MKRETPGQLHLPFNSNEKQPDLQNITSSSFQNFSKHQELINNTDPIINDEPINLVNEEELNEDQPIDLEKRKNEVIIQYDIPENLCDSIHFDEDGLSPKDLIYGCYLGNQSLHDYLEGRDIENEIQSYGIPKELHSRVVLDDHHNIKIDGLSLADYKTKADKEAEAYKKRIEKTRQKLPKIVAKHLGWWQNYDNY